MYGSSALPITPFYRGCVSGSGNLIAFWAFGLWRFVKNSVIWKIWLIYEAVQPGLSSDAIRTSRVIERSWTYPWKVLITLVFSVWINDSLSSFSKHAVCATAAPPPHTDPPPWFPTVPCFTYWTQSPAQEWSSESSRNVAPSRSQKHNTRQAQRPASREPRPLCHWSAAVGWPLAASPSSLPAALWPIRALSCCSEVCVCVCHHTDPYRQHRRESSLV